MSTWNTDSTNCDGSSTTVKTNLYCIIPMSTLTAAPYSYAFDELVLVTVTATNSYGDGPASDINTSGAKIRSVPSTMTDPFRGSTTTDYQI